MTSIHGVLLHIDELLASRIEQIVGLLHVKTVDRVLRRAAQVNRIACVDWLRVGGLRTPLLLRLDKLLLLNQLLLVGYAALTFGLAAPVVVRCGIAGAPALHPGISLFGRNETSVALLHLTLHRLVYSFSAF
jgi:hypothetical protein